MALEAHGESAAATPAQAGAGTAGAVAAAGVISLEERAESEALESVRPTLLPRMHLALAACAPTPAADHKVSCCLCTCSRRQSCRMRGGNTVVAGWVEAACASRVPGLRRMLTAQQGGHTGRRHSSRSRLRMHAARLRRSRASEPRWSRRVMGTSGSSMSTVPSSNDAYIGEAVVHIAPPYLPTDDVWQ